MGVSASGCHHNLSLWRGGEQKLSTSSGMTACRASRITSPIARAGRTPSCRVTGDPKPGPIGLHCIGGIIKHVGALTAIGSSTVNSYRRLWDTGFWAPVYADWGYQNRTCALRISAPGRFEYRSVDSTVNPYLMAGAILKAFDDGINHKLDPGEPEERNI